MNRELAGTVSLDLAVVGAGYVGLVASACFAAAGHRVVCLDRDPARIAAILDGRLPVWEPGLPERLAAGRANLSFTTDPRAVATAEIVLLAVGTPSGLDAAVDLADLDAALEAVLPWLAPRALLVVKSTTPVGTLARVRERFGRAGLHNPLATCPEFLREGSAIADLDAPDRVVIGTDDPDAAARLAPLYPGAKRILRMDPASAELAKYAANALLAARVSFVNELADLATATGADIDAVREALAADHRIGPHHLEPGPGWGGSCCPKDLAALASFGRGHGVEATIAEAALRSNALHVERWVARIRDLLDPIAGRRIAAWGLAFKADTDDVRYSPALAVVRALADAGARVTVHDPVALVAARGVLGDRVGYAPDAWSALAGADALVIGTAWAAYRDADLARIARELPGRVIVDGRNLWRPATLAGGPLRYHSVGRPSVGGLA